MRWSPAALLTAVALVLGACATGEQVYVSGREDSDDDDDDAAPAENAPLLVASAQGVLIARGNALLPGALVDAGGPRPIRSGPSFALVNATLLPRGMSGAGTPTATASAPPVQVAAGPVQANAGTSGPATVALGGGAPATGIGSPLE